MEASNLPDTEFKNILIRLLKEFSENFNSMKKDIETLKKEPVINEEYNIWNKEYTKRNK